jgi:hypothetical protein
MTRCRRPRRRPRRTHPPRRLVALPPARYLQVPLGPRLLRQRQARPQPTPQLPRSRRRLRLRRRHRR